MAKIELYDGKYTIILEEGKPYVFKCLRHGEEWRDLVGDGMVYELVYAYMDAQDEIARLKSKLRDVNYEAEYLDGLDELDY